MLQLFYKKIIAIKKDKSKSIDIDIELFAMGTFIACPKTFPQGNSEDCQTN